MAVLADINTGELCVMPKKKEQIAPAGDLERAAAVTDAEDLNEVESAAEEVVSAVVEETAAVTDAEETSVGQGSPDMASADALVEEPVIKRGGTHVKVRGFFGAFHRAVFLEDESKQFGEAYLSNETLEALRSEFPGAEIHILD